MIGANLQTSFLTPPFGFALFLFPRRRTQGCENQGYLSRSFAFRGPADGRFGFDHRRT